MIQDRLDHVHWCINVTNESLNRVGKLGLLMYHDLSEFASLILITTWGHALNEAAHVHVLFSVV